MSVDYVWSKFIDYLSNLSKFSIEDEWDHQFLASRNMMHCDAYHLLFRRLKASNVDIMTVVHKEPNPSF